MSRVLSAALLAALCACAKSSETTTASTTTTATAAPTLDVHAQVQVERGDGRIAMKSAGAMGLQAPTGKAKTIFNTVKKRL